MNRYLKRLGYIEKSAGVLDAVKSVGRGISHGVLPGARKLTNGVISAVDRAAGSGVREVISRHVPEDILKSLDKVKSRAHLSDRLHDLHFDHADNAFKKDFSEYSRKVSMDPASAHLHSAEGAALKARSDKANEYASSKTKSIVDKIRTELEDSVKERSASKGALLVGGAAATGLGALAYKKGKKAGIREGNPGVSADMYLQEPAY